MREGFAAKSPCKYNFKHYFNYNFHFIYVHMKFEYLNKLFKLELVLNFLLELESPSQVFGAAPRRRGSTEGSSSRRTSSGMISLDPGFLKPCWWGPASVSATVGKHLI